jgi:bifunctional NMN adenylyltransferase/nudix hydrolase
MQYEYAVVIGQFQPFHLAHHKILDLAFAKADRVIVALGSHRVAPTIKTPWTSEERENMLRAALTPDRLDRLHVIAIRDYLYNHNLWLAELQGKMQAITSGSRSVALVGHLKDPSRDYLSGFPQWKFEPFSQRLPINASDIRQQVFRQQPDWHKLVPPSTRRFIEQFSHTETFHRLVEEQAFVDQYQRDWAAAPYPPTFVTADAVVCKSGHVLVVKRRGYPGKGLWALPGGFVNQNETVERAAVRELREETGLTISAAELKKYIQASAVFDHPERSLRGRTITHGFYFDLGAFGDLPLVKGGSDSQRAWWMPLSDVYIHEDQFFEDHVSIITHFVNKF